MANLLQVVQEIKNRTDIAEFIGRYVPLKKSGQNYLGLCPFHGDKHPSFMVNSSRGQFQCWSSACNKHGDVIDFVIESEGWEWIEAVRFLANNLGIELPATDLKREEELKKQRLERESLEAAVKYAAELYNMELNNWDEGTFSNEPSDYLEKRGLKPEIIAKFEIGYAPSDGRFILKKMNQQGDLPYFNLNELLDTGLIAKDEAEDKFYSFFRERIMFPIRDANGRYVGFGGRAFRGNRPKYLNSLQTALFDKGRILYGLNFAKQAIKRQDLAVIVEGYMDVVIAHQEGYTNVVAPLGTALNKNHIEMLLGLTNNIVIVFDGDEAGEVASTKALDMMRLGQDYRDLNLQVCCLPQGFDPDELILAEPKTWEGLLLGPMDAVEFHMHLEGKKVSGHWPTASECKLIVDKIAPLIAETKDPIKVEQYCQRLAAMTRLPLQLIKDEVRNLKSQAKAFALPVGIGKLFQPDIYQKSYNQFTIEDRLMAELIRYYPSSLTAISNDGSPVMASDFTLIENKMLFQILEDMAAEWKEIESLEEYLAEDPSLYQQYQFLMTVMASVPTLDDGEKSRQAVAHLLNRVRRHKLQELYNDMTSNLDMLLEVAEDEFNYILGESERISGRMRIYK